MAEEMQQETRVVGIEQFLFEQLNKRNQQFMRSVDKNLVAANLDATTRQAVYTEMTETLIQGQQTGQTARQLYGTPTECAAVILKQQFPTMDENAKSPDWQIALDGALILGSAFTFLTGMSMNRAQGDNRLLMMGIITLILNYLVAGYTMLITSKALPNMDAPKGQKGYGKYFLVATLSMLLWVGIVGGATWLLPKSIDIILPQEAYLIIGASTFFLRFYLKRRWNIRGGLF